MIMKRLVKSAMMFLFKEARYAISNSEIKLVSHLGQATSLFGLITLPNDFSMSSGLRRCWSKDTTSDAYNYKYHISRIVPAVVSSVIVSAIA